jgi:glycosyltransferase involved in cell wall biosynthesis
LTVGFFSPLPPVKTGVADYSAALLDDLRKRGRVEVNDPNADVALYHIGNNHLHREIYAMALEKPGVVVLHDAVLNHFFLGTLDERGYCDEFVFNYGEWMRGLAEDLWRNRARSAADPRYFAYPMLKRIVGRSRAVIVHNPAAARIAQRHGAARVIEIPHLFVKPELPDLVETLRFRVVLGLKPRTLLVGVFGHLREAKRITALLRAMEEAWRTGANARLLIAGECASSDLARAIERVDDSRILRTGFLEDGEFWRYAAACDLCVNLRYPSAGETSGIGIRMMGIGKAVAFTNGEEIECIPADACLRVDLGPSEEEILAGMIVWLASDRDACEEIGRRAAAYVTEECAIEKVGDRYWAALESARLKPHAD